jgi:predicted nucleic acid-binding protein
VARLIVLDSGDLGLACQKPGHPLGGLFREWMFLEWANGAMIVVPELADYEVRRSLMLAGFLKGIDRLDDLYQHPARYLPISTAAMRTAARLWAQARRRGEPTAHDQALDGDVIVAARAIEFCSDSDDWIIATENVADLPRYVGSRARSWIDISKVGKV